MEEDKIKQQIDLIMESLESISRAQANPFLYEKIMNRMNEPSGVKRIVDNRFSLNLKYVLTILILIILNLFTIVQFSSDISKTEKKNIIEYFEEEYSLITKTNYN